MKLDDRVERLRETHRSLGTVKLMLGRLDTRLGKATGGQNADRLIELRSQVGRAYREIEKAEMWAFELRALEAGEAHPGRGRSFGGRVDNG